MQQGLIPSLSKVSYIAENRFTENNFLSILYFCFMKNNLVLNGSFRIR